MPQFIYFIEPTRPTFPQDATPADSATISAHFDYLQTLLADGRLILAGRTLEPTPTGVVVFTAPDDHVAEDTFRNDPAVQAGLFQGRVAPYRVALSRAGLTAGTDDG